MYKDVAKEIMYVVLARLRALKARARRGNERAEAYSIAIAELSEKYASLKTTYKYNGDLVNELLIRRIEDSKQISETVFNLVARFLIISAERIDTLPPLDLSCPTTEFKGRFAETTTFGLF